MHLVVDFSCKFYDAFYPLSSYISVNDVCRKHTHISPAPMRGTFRQHSFEDDSARVSLTIFLVVICFGQLEIKVFNINLSSQFSGA